MDDLHFRTGPAPRYDGPYLVVTTGDEGLLWSVADKYICGCFVRHDGFELELSDVVAWAALQKEVEEHD